MQSLRPILCTGGRYIRRPNLVQLAGGTTRSRGFGNAPPENASRTNRLLWRLLKPGADGRNRILAALGYYSAESRALGTGNSLYGEILRVSCTHCTQRKEPESFPARFEMIAVHVYLTLRRLRSEKGSPLQTHVETVMQCMFDVFWTDVRNRLIIREAGLKLLASGKWVKHCERMFFGMALSFDESWLEREKMLAAVKRNITSLNADDREVRRFVNYMFKEKSRLDKIPIQSILDGAQVWNIASPSSSARSSTAE